MARLEISTSEGDLGLELKLESQGLYWIQQAKDLTSMYKKESKRRSTETAQVDMQRFDVAEEDVRDRL